MNHLVLDASVALAWFIQDEHSSYAEQVLAEAKTSTFVVPQHWSLEMVNGFVLAERAGRMEPGDVARSILVIQSLAIEVDPETFSSALTTALLLCRQYSLTAYDGAYLELATRLGYPLATLDKKLIAAAFDNVPLFKPTSS